MHSHTGCVSAVCECCGCMYWEGLCTEKSVGKNGRGWEGLSVVVLCKVCMTVAVATTSMSCSECAVTRKRP